MAVPPSLDTFITVPGLLDFHYTHNTSRPVFVFAKDGEDITEISFLEFVRASHRLAHIVRPGRTGPDGTVVAVVALADTLVYEAIIAGVVKAGLVVRWLRVVHTFSHITHYTCSHSRF